MGGLARNLIFGLFGIRSNVDVNTLLDTGGYYLTTGITNANQYSYLLVVKYSNKTCSQFNISNGGGYIKMRCLNDSGVWSEWKSISFTNEI